MGSSSIEEGKRRDGILFWWSWSRSEFEDFPVKVLAVESSLGFIYRGEYILSGWDRSVGVEEDRYLSEFAAEE